MAQKTEKLEQEKYDSLLAIQNKTNELLINLGQIHLRVRELTTEIERLNEIKTNTETQSDDINAEFSKLLKELEEKYPKGEIDLKEGTVTFESAE
jgi:chromosome segregation ATPase